MSDGGGSGLTMGIVFLFTVGVGALMLALFVAERRAQERRREALRGVAGRLHLSFVPDPGTGPLAGLGRFSILRRGHGQRLANLMEGRAGEAELQLFDYRYTTGSGRNSHTHRQTVLVLRAPELVLPAFELQPENTFHRLGGLVGMRDVNVEEDRAFSAAFWLRGPDEEAIRAAFRPDVRATYLRRAGLCTQAEGQEMVLFRPDQVVPPESIQAFVEEGLDVLGAFKRQAGTLSALDVWGLDLEIEEEQQATV